MIPHRRRVLRLAAYAESLPGPEHFQLVEERIPALGEGQVLLRTDWLGMDPFPRLRMSGDASRAPQLPLGSPMIGRGVGQVIASRHAGYAEGAWLTGEIGWQDHVVVDPAVLAPVDLAPGDVRLSLSVLGPTGLAAWCALNITGRAQAGETVLISAAAGGVGSLLTQLALAQGCQVLAIGGGPAQLAYLHDELGLATVLDYTSARSMRDQLQAAGQPVDLFFDLVGGQIFDAGIEQLALLGRAVLLGTVSDYNRPAGAADVGPRPNLQIILKRCQISGFLLSDHATRFPEALADLSTRVREGKLVARERIVEGLENAPLAFAGLFGAEFIGKQLVHVGNAGP